MDHSEESVICVCFSVWRGVRRTGAAESEPQRRGRPPREPRLREAQQTSGGRQPRQPATAGVVSVVCYSRCGECRSRCGECCVLLPVR